jgi:hypothetical protein
MDVHPESSLPKIERRFGTVTAPLDQPNRRKRFYRALTFLAVAAIGASSALVWYFSASPWSFVLTLKDFAAFHSCRAAQAVGLAPAACEAAGRRAPQQKPSGPKWVVPPQK